MKKFKQAFTLFELLIVMAIIAIISVGGLLGARYAMRIARDTRKRDIVNQVSTAIGAYSSDNSGQYPPAGTLASPLNIKEFVEVAQISDYSENLDFSAILVEQIQAYSGKTEYAICACLEKVNNETCDDVNLTTLSKKCFCKGTSSDEDKVTLCKATSN